MSTKVRGLACLFFVAHFAASVLVVLASIGSMAFLETGPQPAPNRLLELAADALPFPILPIALSLPNALTRFIPWWTPLMVNSLLWVGVALLFASKRVHRPRAA